MSDNQNKQNDPKDQKDPKKDQPKKDNQPKKKDNQPKKKDDKNDNKNDNNPPEKVEEDPSDLITREAENTGKRDFLREIEISTQKYWKDNKTFELDAPENYTENGWVGTFPYPYMNGKLHLGHGFTISKVEFLVGYQRLLGNKAIFPFGFHCTGMPIKANADKIKREMELYGNPPKFPEEKQDEKNVNVAKKIEAKQGGSKYQWNIMKESGIPEDIIERFADANYWLEYFPYVSIEDLSSAGFKIDWRRSFITTDVNPYYDAFVRWQFRKLKRLGRVKFGKRFTIYSPLDGQPCMDHDRAEGEGVDCQEYTIVKQEVQRPYPSCLSQFEKDNRKIYLIPATLRPETMYGQTNCWIRPNGDYGAFEFKNDEIFICSDRAARNLSFQEMTSQEGKVVKLASFKGQELIGTALKAPLTQYNVIYVLPMESVSMEKGTGVVTSVPSDSPDDYANFRDLKEKEVLRNQFGVKDEWILNFEVIPIISIEGFGNTAAISACDQFSIKSRKDTELLNKAKEEVYNKGFYSGVMIIGPHSGKLVKDVKPIIRDELIKNGSAAKYAEPESEVTSRSGDVCVVALCNQWYIDYGDQEWKKLAFECIDKMVVITDEVRNQLTSKLDWLHEWACSRSYGLGTKLPWDEQYLIESLSDSTIYMAFYTICNKLHESIDGKKAALITPEQLNDDLFEYVFGDGPFTDEIKVPESTLKKLKHEFKFWYPVNLRVSGKDLIGNHLLFFILNHVTLFSKELWPKCIRCNGHLLLNEKKMSKRTGNFITLSDAVKRYSADGMRFALADSGDQLEDANFTTKNADTAILKLWNIVDWIKKWYSSGEYAEKEINSYIERVFESEIYECIINTLKFYESMNFKEVLKNGYFELVNARDKYIKAVQMLGEKPNRFLIELFIDALIKLNAPITSHICEYLWRDVLKKEGSVFDSKFPSIPSNFDYTIIKSKSYVESTMKNFRDKKKGFLKKNKNVPPVEARIYVFNEWPSWKERTIKLLKSVYDPKNNSFPDNKTISSLIGSDEELQKKMKEAMPFVNEVTKVIKDNANPDAYVLELSFSEQGVFNVLGEYFKKELGVENVKIFSASDSDLPDNVPKQQGQPGSPIVFFS